MNQFPNRLTDKKPDTLDKGGGVESSTADRRDAAARSISAAWTIAAAFLAQPAIAQESPVTLNFASAVAWEANLFRLPDTADDPHLARGISGKSDRLSTTTVGLNIAKAYSQQHLLVNVAQTLTRYDKFTFLDSENISYRGDWQWHLSPYISGTISVVRNETPVAFDETRDREANTLISTNRSFAVTVSPFGGWQLLGGVRQAGRKYARPNPEQPDSDQSGLEAGLRYTAASQSSISLTRRSNRGTSSLDETELLVAWPVTGKSTLSGRLVRIEQRYSDTPERNFSGVAGGFSHSWTPTGRLSLTFSAQRSLTPFIQDTRSSYLVQNTVSVTPTWQLSDRIQLSMAASRQVSDYLGPLAAQTDPARRDTVRSASVAAAWSPIRAVSVRASLRRDRRSSNDALSAYEATVASINASLSF